MRIQIIILLFALGFLLLASCCPEIRKQSTHTEKKLIEVRNDTVYIDRIIPKIEITEESATYITKASVEIIDTVVKAKGTLRDYRLKVVRRNQPKKIISGDSVKIDLMPDYDIQVTAEKPDSLFNEVTTSKTEYHRGRPWYEIPLYALSCAVCFVIGIFIGRKFL